MKENGVFQTSASALKLVILEFNVAPAEIDARKFEDSSSN